jgi:hypothetical protein
MTNMQIVVRITASESPKRLKRERSIMITSLIAGLSLLILSGVANTYISYLLFGEEKVPTDKENV